MPSFSPKIGRHYRAPWRQSDPTNVWVHARFDVIKGSFRTSIGAAKANLERYERAKKRFDISAATDIVEEHVDAAAVDLLIAAVISADKPPVIVMPHPEYDAGMDHDAAALKPTNAIPFAFANHLAVILDCDVDDQIIEIARPGRTKLKNFPRFLWQPKFAGEVRRDCSYIIADDVCTVCGTLAMLRSYIVENGGTVIAATTLAHNNGIHQTFPIDARMVGVLKSVYTNGINDLWKEEIGHDIESLTQNEGIRLAEWARDRNVSHGYPRSLLQLLRDRLAEAAGKAR